MAKEAREIVDFQEQQAMLANGGSLSVEGTKYFQELRALIDKGEEEGFFSSRIPADSQLTIAKSGEYNLSVQQGVVSINSLRDQLYEELKVRGQKVELPKPPQAIIEIQHILKDHGYSVVPELYLSERDVVFGLIETIARPDYGEEWDVTDPLAHILEVGRREEKIAVPPWVSGIAPTSRFAVSWDEVHGFVDHEIVNLSYYLTRQIENSGAEMRVPTNDEFSRACVRKDHFVKSKSREWLYDDVGNGRRLVSKRLDGRVASFNKSYPSKNRYVDVGFRIQFVFPPQIIQ